MIFDLMSISLSTPNASKPVENSSQVRLPNDLLWHL